MVTGEAVLGEDTPIDLGFAELLVGHGSGGHTVMRFELAAARMSVADLIVAQGEELFGVDESVLETEDASFQAFWSLGVHLLGSATLQSVPPMSPGSSSHE